MEVKAARRGESKKKEVGHHPLLPQKKKLFYIPKKSLS